MMIEKIQVFFKEVKLETKKVAFPSREELIGSTWVVLIFTVVLSMFLGIVDMGLSKLIQSMIK
ncbi:preprotein translocase subunit SecE [Candidatus Magnetominusculus dajiuhuensis]|uniref:preprotein translocase subunit SecE n=1 Tax=Candidatus Magnetominusculus dajiuhuensis TaxID=3137712 RepID=UPI003B42E4A5